MAPRRADAAAVRAEDTSPIFDKKWRLSNLYAIQDKNSRRVPFRPNEAQLEYLDHRHGRDVIVKARQLGFSTMIDIDMLDDVVFNRNFTGQIIAHTLPDARKLFATKIKYPYESIPDQLKGALVQESKTGDSLVFGGKHRSSIHVSTSARSGTINYLHVSEMGKIAATMPQKALEIVTGSFEAVPLSGRIVVESTAEGAYGQFHDLAMAAKRKRDAGSALSRLDFALHFHPWWKSPEYELEESAVILDAELDEYFDSLLDNHGIFLTPAQKAWYASKREVLQERIFQEYPSTFEEAFQASLEGAYYSQQMARMRVDNRIGRVAYNPHYPVYTGWDLGLDDYTSIWFAQFYGGYDLRLIDYHEERGRGIEHYVRLVNSKPYLYDHHFLPHDSRKGSQNSEIEGERLEQTARRLGLRPLTVVRRPTNMEEVVTRDINIVRSFLSRASIDYERCQQGIRCLDAYQAEWDERLGTYARRPLHNWASHGADAMRVLAVGLQRRYLGDAENESPPLEREPAY